MGVGCCLFGLFDYFGYEVQVGFGGWCVLLVVGVVVGFGDGVVVQMLGLCLDLFDGVGYWFNVGGVYSLYLFDQ